MLILQQIQGKVDENRIHETCVGLQKSVNPKQFSIDHLALIFIALMPHLKNQKVEKLIEAIQWALEKEWDKYESEWQTSHLNSLLLYFNFMKYLGDSSKSLECTLNMFPISCVE